MAANALSGPHGRDITAAEAGATKPAENPSLGDTSFSDVLDALNPLQYLPVVGTIYRVVTGDVGSPALRTAVSLVLGAVTGGPIGFLTSLAGNLFEHVFHVEDAVHGALAGAGHAARPASAAAPAATAAPAAVAAAPDAPAPPMARAALTAYAEASAYGSRLAWGGRER